MSGHELECELTVGVDYRISSNWTNASMLAVNHASIWSQQLLRRG